MKDMLNVMDKFLALGMSLDEVIRQSLDRRMKFNTTSWEIVGGRTRPMSPC